MVEVLEVYMVEKSLESLSSDLTAQAFLSPPAAFVQKIMWNACVHSTWE